MNVIARNAALTGEFRAVFAQGHGQTELIQRGRMQSAGEAAQVAIQAGYTILKDVGRLAGGGAGSHVRSAQAHERQPLA